MASATQRLTRGALKKISDSGSGGATEREELTPQQRRLVDEHRAFQQGLEWPAKRRRLSVGEQPDAAMGSVVSRCRGEADVAVEPKQPTPPTPPAPAAPTTSEDSASAAHAAPLPELALATDEKGMNGAPEGELFVVNVLSRDEIQPSSDVDAERQELERVLALTGKDDSLWATEYAALDSLRRFAIHHKEQLDAALLSTALASLVCPAATNLRSAMARNALLCVHDLVSSLRERVAEHAELLVPLLVQRAANEKQFIRELAREVLDACVINWAGDAMLPELLALSSTGKNAQVIGIAGVYTSKCVANMGDSALKAFVNDAPMPSFWENVATFLNCKVVECKTATRTTLQLMRRALGDEAFTELIKANLSGSAQMDMLSASAERKKKTPVAARSGLPNLSMRKRMLQMKQQQQEQQQPREDRDIVVVSTDTGDKEQR
ncbi:hypothetical protein ATCC90586_007649 [Pythium insidiosum]|nr:hypothetical protein ATCC90586_007649 [Pythium insidiosum]